MPNAVCGDLILLIIFSDERAQNLGVAPANAALVAYEIARQFGDGAEFFFFHIFLIPTPGEVAPAGRLLKSVVRL